MEEIVTPTGARVCRNNGVLYQHLDFSNPRTQQSFASSNWHQDIGGDAEMKMPSLRPVHLRSFPKGMFFDGSNGPVLVAPGDFVARDADGGASRVPAERVRDFVALRVPADAPRAKIDEAGRSVLERTSRVRELARSRADEEAPSPISIKEDENGRAALVSYLPDGREKTWKSFAWKEAAEAFLADEKKHADLLKSHEAACKNIRSVNDLAHAFRMDRKAGLER